MIYGIDQTTDLRHPETRIEKFRSRDAAVKWASKPAEFAWPSAANNELPGPQQNFHHRLRDIYDMPPGWKPPTEREQRDWTLANMRSSYRRNGRDFIAQRIRRDGDRILVQADA